MSAPENPLLPVSEAAKIAADDILLRLRAYDVVLYDRLVWIADNGPFRQGLARFEASLQSPPAASQDGEWALCYLHDWDPPKPDNAHIQAQVHGIYPNQKEAEEARKSKINPERDIVVRANRWRFIDGKDVMLPRAEASQDGAGMREALAIAEELNLAADELNGELDRQTYDERIKLGDYPDDATFDVTLTARQMGDFNDAIVKWQHQAQHIARAALTHQGELQQASPIEDNRQ